MKFNVQFFEVTRGYYIYNINLILIENQLQTLGGIYR